MFGCQGCAILAIIFCIIVAIILIATKKYWMPAYTWVKNRAGDVKDLLSSK